MDLSWRRQDELTFRVMEVQRVAHRAIYESVNELKGSVHTCIFLVPSADEA